MPYSIYKQGSEYYKLHYHTHHKRCKTWVSEVTSKWGCGARLGMRRRYSFIVQHRGQCVIFKVQGPDVQTLISLSSG